MVIRLKICKPVIPVTIQIWSDFNADFDETSKLSECLISSSVDNSLKSFSLSSSLVASSTWNTDSLVLEDGLKLVI